MENKYQSWTLAKTIINHAKGHCMREHNAFVAIPHRPPDNAGGPVPGYRGATPLFLKIGYDWPRTQPITRCRTSK
jgi:hypothetical protein